MLGIILIIIPNVIIFVIIPRTWEKFLKGNLGGLNIVEINHSFSLSKIILNLFHFSDLVINPLSVLVFLLLIFGIPGYGIFVYSKPQKESILYGITLGLIIMLLIYFDSWNHHLLILISLYTIMIFDLVEGSSKRNRILKHSLQYFVFFDLIFMGVWYLFELWFPYNFLATIFLLLSFYGLGKYLLENLN
jgi:hypothetical protein